MASSINADNGVVSGSSGLKSTADTSGVLALQSNGSTGLTLNTDLSVTFAGAQTLSAGTANGVTYLNGSKVLTSGSALTFDGTNLGVGANITASAASAPSFTVGTGSGSPAITLYSATNGSSQISFADATSGSGAYDGYILYDQSSQSMVFGRASAENMRLTSTGLGIGTSSPSAKLDVNSSGAVVMRLTRNGGTASNTGLQYYNGTNSWYAGMSGVGFYAIGYNDANLDVGQLRLDSSGNLGLGVTPSAAAGYTTFDVSNATSGARIRLLVGSTPYGIFYTNGTTDVRLQTAASVPLLLGTNYNEYLRIAPSGAFGLSGANYGTSGQVLTSQGSGSAPTWAAAAGGSQAFVAFGSTGGL